MNIGLIYLLVSFAVSLICGMVFIPAIIAFCKRKNLYDLPNARKVHKNRVPRLGGVCFAPCMMLAMALALAAFNNTLPTRQVTLNLWSLYFCIALLLIYGVGLIDDLIGLDAKIKFAVQILSASLLPLAGLYINDLYGLFGIHEIPYAVGFPLTVFLIVFIDNAINLIDGIDGLSSGLSFIALSGFLLCYMREGIWIYSILIIGLMGVLLTFMYFNLFGKPGKNKIFMGDSGSLTIGFILGFLLVKFIMVNTAALPFRRENMVLAFSYLIVPIFDVCRVIIVRIAHGKPIFDADKNHIHHKIMRTGLNQHLTLLAILALALLFILVNVTMLDFCDTTIIVIADIALWLIAQQIINRFIRRNHQNVYLQAESEQTAKTA